MSTERDMIIAWKFLIPFFLALFQPCLSSDFPSQGCYWTDTCLHKLTGDCGGLVYNQSSNCNGHCKGFKYRPCPSDHTHFYCCVAGSPNKVKDGCKKCENKVDDGDEFICCDDCTYPEMVYGDGSLGYCKSGAELISQPKPREVFKWVASPWLPCSSPCAGGIRSRRVECFAVVEDASSPDYPVYDDHCSDQLKPISQEPCNLQSCADNGVNHPAKHQIHRRTSSWVVTVLIILGVLMVVAAVGFAAFILYRRKSSSDQGYVYIMMEGYS